MSHKESIRRAEVLRRVAELRRRQSIAEAAEAGRAAQKARETAEAAREWVAQVSDVPVADAAELLTRQSRVLAAASAHADLVRAAGAAELAARDAMTRVVEASVVLRGRERLKERRVRAREDERLTVQQRLLDEVALRRGNGEEE